MQYKLVAPFSTSTSCHPIVIIHWNNRKFISAILFFFHHNNIAQTIFKTENVFIIDPRAQYAFLYSAAQVVDPWWCSFHSGDLSHVDPGFGPGFVKIIFLFGSSAGQSQILSDANWLCYLVKDGGGFFCSCETISPVCIFILRAPHSCFACVSTFFILLPMFEGIAIFLNCLYLPRLMGPVSTLLGLLYRVKSELGQSEFTYLSAFHPPQARYHFFTSSVFKCAGVQRYHSFGAFDAFRLRRGHTNHITYWSDNGEVEGSVWKLKWCLFLCFRWQQWVTIVSRPSSVFLPLTWSL